MTVDEFKALYDSLTIPELDSLTSQWSLRAKDLDYPLWLRDKNKTENYRHLLHWIRRTTQPKRDEFVKDMQAISARKSAYPVRGEVPGTRYITWSEFTKLPSYSMISRAVSFRYTHARKADPMTKDGYVSVAAIYNLSAWASWKSSSLGAGEKAVADAIHKIPLLALMDLNHGRQTNQPALFPLKGVFLPARNPKNPLIEALVTGVGFGAGLHAAGKIMDRKNPKR